ncbi:MAG: DUF1570 domain-containing protein [Pirellulaceae bacterium]|nr:DUF1570 domain-containing protein [Pirellulaceae bacterium]
MTSSSHAIDLKRRNWLYRSALGTGALTFLWPTMLPTLLLGADSQAAHRWPYEASTGMFCIHADFDVSQGGDFLVELDQLMNDVRGLLGTPAPKSIIHMVLFSSSDEYRRYMTHYYPSLPARRALFIQQRGTAMLFAHRHPEMATDLRHESVHALLNSGESALPLWLDEGLAEYFEGPADKRWSGHPHLHAVQQRAADQSPGTQTPELQTLEELNQVADMSGEQYRDAWAWVHFLLHRRQSTRRLILDQLEQLCRGRPAQPLSRCVAAQLPDWRTEFNHHFRALTPNT